MSQIAQMRKIVAIVEFVKRVEVCDCASMHEAVQFMYPYGDYKNKTQGMYRKVRSIVKKERERLISVKRVEFLNIDQANLPYIFNYTKNNILIFRKIVYVRQGEYEMSLFNKSEKGDIAIHVAFGSAKIITQLGEQKTENIVNTFNSVLISEENRTNAAVKIRISGPHACIFLEQNVKFKQRRLINRQVQQVLNITRIKRMRNDIAYVEETEFREVTCNYSMSTPISRIPISYVRNLLPVEEIRRRILFLDCEFVGGYKELNKFGKWKGTSLLASICIMKYNGEILLNTRVTPTKKIKSYVKWITGFTPQDLRNKRKDVEIIMDVQKLVNGRILIGHDLTADLEVLKINRETLMGIRDLSTSIVLREVTDCENSRLKLANLATELLGRSIYNELGQHCGLRDVRAIRDIYIKFEQQWLDDIHVKEYGELYDDIYDSDRDFDYP